MPSESRVVCDEKSFQHASNHEGAADCSARSLAVHKSKTTAPYVVVKTNAQRLSQRRVPQFGSREGNATLERPLTSQSPAQAVLPLPPVESPYYSSMSMGTSTPITADFSKERYIEAVTADRVFCEKYFPGHTTSIASSIEDVVRLTGGEVFLGRYAQACTNTRPRVTEEVLAEFERCRAKAEGQLWSSDYSTPWCWVNGMTDLVCNRNCTIGDI